MSKFLLTKLLLAVFLVFFLQIQTPAQTASDNKPPDKTEAPQKTAPDKTAPTDARENLPLTEPGATPGTAQPQPDTPNLFKLLFYTVLVIILICLVLFGIKKFLPGSKRLFASDTIQIIAKRPLDSNHTIYLVLIGNRILKIAASKTDVVLLGEESDPAEVSLLKIKCNVNKPDSSQTAFKTALTDATNDLVESDKHTLRAESYMNLKKELDDIKNTIKNWSDKNNIDKH